MASLNKVTLIGNLGKDPEVRTFADGNRVANITIATTDKWKDKTSGEQKEATEWHRISFTGRLAEIVEQYLKKGATIYVEGSLHTRKYQDKDGVEKYATEIKGSSMQMLGGKGGDSGNSAAASKPAGAKAPAGGFDDMDDDIPF